MIDLGWLAIGEIGLAIAALLRDAAKHIKGGLCRS
jgi:hypothetical protein